MIDLYFIVNFSTQLLQNIREWYPHCAWVYKFQTNSIIADTVWIPPPLKLHSLTDDLLFVGPCHLHKNLGKTAENNHLGDTLQATKTFTNMFSYELPKIDLMKKLWTKNHSYIQK